MSIEALRDALPDYARDIKLNLGMVLSPEGAPDLTQNQIMGIALAVAYATRNSQLVSAIAAESANVLSAEEQNAAKAAATIMAMNNVYYRYTHYVGDKEVSALPAKLRMNIIANPGIPKVDFEIYSLAVSSVNGCGMCMDAHTHVLAKAGLSKQSIQSAVRIAAVVNAAAQALFIANNDEATLALAA